jgi:glycerophosphoryl diester phosphodiesterase
MKLCAHRGLSHACPENTLPAFGAAIALGVDEIEFDLWLSADGVPVVCHDPRVDRTTNGTGIVTEMNWVDIQKLDAGIQTGDLWRNVRVPCLDDVLDLAGDRVGLNIHIKNPGPGNRLIEIVCDEIQNRGLVERAYIAGIDDVLEAARETDESIMRCCLAGQNTPDLQVDLAIKYACQRLQFRRELSDEAIQRAKRQGLICNLFWSDELLDAQAYAQRGIDVILTNRANFMQMDNEALCE